MTLTETLRARAKDAARTVTGVALGLALALAFVPTGALAQPSSSNEPALWVVRDHDSTIYLFGTVHLLRPETQWRTPSIDEAMSRADELWFEIADVDNPNAALPYIQRYGLSTTPLSRRVGPEMFARVTEVTDALGLPAQAIEAMQPWLVGLTISSMGIVQAGYDPTSGVEIRLKSTWAETGRPVRELETVEQQMRFFADMPESAQIEFLEAAIEGYNDGAAMLDGLVDAWAVGDVTAMERIMLDEMREQWGGTYEVLIVERNRNWAEQIETLLQGSGTAFIAVGAGHLIGPDSVQVFLEQRGIASERVNP